jgi:hypothetical protein
LRLKSYQTLNVIKTEFSLGLLLHLLLLSTLSLSPLVSFFNLFLLGILFRKLLRHVLRHLDTLEQGVLRANVVALSFILGANSAAKACSIWNCRVATCDILDVLDVRDLVVEDNVSLAKLLSLLLLFTNLQVEILLFSDFSGEFLRSLGDIALCHLVKLLELVEEFVLIADQLLLVVDLSTELRHISILVLPLKLNLRFESTLIVFFLLDCCFLCLHLHAQ